jgi:hypothetical protein
MGVESSWDHILLMRLQLTSTFLTVICNIAIDDSIVRSYLIIMQLDRVFTKLILNTMGGK